MKCKTCCLTLTLILSSAANAEIGRMKVDHYCSFNDEPLPSILTTFDSDTAAQQALNRVMSFTGLPPRFEILAADVPNAAAVIRNNKRYILYNQRFMRKVRDTTKNNWSEISILAHEIGHHLSNHTFQFTGSRPTFELEADRFSGFVLQRMGASLDDAVAVMERMVSQRGSATHPARSARVAAVTNGWVDAEEKSGRSQFKREPVRPRTVVRNNGSPEHSHNGRSHSHPLPAEGLNHQHNGSQPVPVVRPAPAPVASRIPEPEMVSIRGGTFMMGSPVSEKGRISNEMLHSVTVGNFSIGKYEVTNAEYARCVSSGFCKAPEWQKKGSIYNLKNGSNDLYHGIVGDNYPVVGVSWHDAMSYVSWLSKMTGKVYSLPTEAQWEYATRAGSQSAYAWGSNISHELANYGSDICCDGFASGRDSWLKTAPVRSFPNTQWGLYDAYGNVAELTCSVYMAAYDGSEQKCSSAYDKRHRVTRGGSWGGRSKDLRSAARSSRSASSRDGATGFRLSLAP